MKLIDLPRPPPAKGKDALARWFSIVAFALGMGCLTLHHGL